MAGVEITQMNAAPDILATFRFLLSLPQLPGGGSPDVLNLLCQQFEWPGSTIEQIMWDGHGHTLVFPGRRTHSHTITAAFYENKQMQLQTSMGAWLEYTRNVRSGNASGSKRGGPGGSNGLLSSGGSGGGYAVDAELGVLDEQGRVAGVSVIRGMWPQDQQPVQFDGASSTAFLQNWTFSFDWVDHVAGLNVVPAAFQQPLSAALGIGA